MSARICALSAVAVAIALIGAGPASAQSNNNTVKKLTKAVTPEGVLEHLEAFQEIADENGGNRAAGLPGYRASVDYVVEQLEAAGYDPEVQEFTFDYFEENSELIRRSRRTRARSSTATDFLRNTFDSGTPRGHRDRPAGPGRPRARTRRCRRRTQHQRLRGGRLRRLPGRRRSRSCSAARAASPSRSSTRRRRAPARSSS